MISQLYDLDNDAKPEVAGSGAIYKGVGKSKKMTIGKYTDEEYFKLKDFRDMVPMVYPTTMHVEPVINTLSKEMDEMNRR